MPVSLSSPVAALDSYEVWIDWDGDGGLYLGSFEAGTDGWIPGGTVLPKVEQSDLRWHSGVGSLLVTWAAGGLFPQAQLPSMPGTSGPVVGIVGVTYTYTAWVWVPTGSAPVKIVVPGYGSGGVSAPSTLFDAWEQLSVTYVYSTPYNFQLWPHPATSGGEQVWFDDPALTGVGEDVTRRLRTRTPITVAYGRDQSRGLSPAAAGRAQFEMDNDSRDYSPDNMSSPLAGYVLPARPVVVKVNLGDTTYTVHRGKFDDYQLQTSPGDRSVQISTLDVWAALLGQDVSTPLFRGLSTGQAIHAVLDAAGWPDDARDIDQGVTVIRHWWAEGTSGDSLAAIVASEGPPALLYFDPVSGRATFRDRHHHLLRAEARSVQATFSDAGTDPRFSWPLGYDQGWKNVINDVTFQVDERQASGELQQVWSSDRSYALADGETLQVIAQGSDPFHGAVPPVSGVDFIARQGAVVAALSRTSGLSTVVSLRCTIGPAVIDTLQVRGYPLPVVRSTQVHAEDAESIRKYGRSTYPTDAPWAGVEHAQAIASVILARWAQPVPIVSVRLAGGTDTIHTHQFLRQLSDRVRVVDAETGIDHDFHVEQVEHVIRGAMTSPIAETTFGCERVVDQVTDVFMFDTPGHGFDDGMFARAGLDDPGSMFLFDVPGQGFDLGLFAT